MRKYLTDSLTPGSQAARTTLNRYAGTHYREWLGGEELVDEAGEGAAAGQRTAIAAGSLVLQPNPSEGPLEVHYQLPAKTAQAVLVIYDSWGREVARYGLEPERTSQQVLLRLRGGLYQCTLLADGVVVTKERLLLSR